MYGILTFLSLQNALFLGVISVEETVYSYIFSERLRLHCIELLPNKNEMESVVEVGAKTEQNRSDTEAHVGTLTGAKLFSDIADNIQTCTTAPDITVSGAFVKKSLAVGTLLHRFPTASVFALTHCLSEFA
ncbi:hypothetical protein J6590_068875 [Homalodisca vitripennis]|nr:hypothetical protein J6590_068875 [Homalodisca vitripennis]